MPRALHRYGAQILIFANAASACDAAAGRIAEAIRSAGAARRRAVLGLATGKTPVHVYARLAELHRARDLSFAGAVSYNLDEYYPISPLDPNSYRWYMDRHLFAQINLPANQAHVLDGTVPEAFVADHAAAYDRWIAADGGLDVQLLGIGRNGHIGFNEPSDLRVESALALPSRLVALHPVTLADAAADFGGDMAAVPRRALTLGTAPILAARAIVMLALGSGKADIVSRALSGPLTAQVPASLLQTVAHKVTWLLDEAAAQGLG
jgi:glucosamine-6-phosphate deaminase